MNIAVVGGGWAGIAAAVELIGAGIEVTLFEAGRVLGGRARSVLSDGHTLDNGQHILLGAYSETLNLMRHIGLDPEKAFERRPLQVIDNTGFRLALPKLPAPLNVAWGLFFAQRVGLQEKLKTALWMEGVKQRHFKLARDLTVSEWLDFAGQTGQLRRHLWEPLCLAALNTPAERASAQLFANVLRDSLGSARRADTDLLIPRCDLGELLPAPARDYLQKKGAHIRLGTRISELTSSLDGVRIEGEAFSAAIIATAPQHAAKLWPSLNVNYDFEPIATVYLQYPPEIRLDFPLRNLIGKLGQWVVDRKNGLLACILSGHGKWELLNDAHLADAMHTELALPAEFLWYKVIREKRATFSCQPNTHRPACETSHPRIFLAGDYTWADYPATLEGAVRSGLRAARRVSTQHA